MGFRPRSCYLMFTKSWGSMTRLVVFAFCGVLLVGSVALAEQSVTNADRSGQEIYEEACAACHRADGTGSPVSTVGFDIPLPDFTDCQFASREPDGDWLAVAHQGGAGKGVRPDDARIRRGTHRR